MCSGVSRCGGGKQTTITGNINTAGFSKPNGAGKRAQISGKVRLIACAHELHILTAYCNPVIVLAAPKGDASDCKGLSRILV